MRYNPAVFSDEQIIWRLEIDLAKAEGERDGLLKGLEILRAYCDLLEMKVGKQ